MCGQRDVVTAWPLDGFRALQDGVESATVMLAVFRDLVQIQLLKSVTNQHRFIRLKMSRLFSSSTIEFRRSISSI